jgi:hypothetical protein
MSLPRGHRRILREIERELRRSDPVLTLVCRTFTRLNRHEDMPGYEVLNVSHGRRFARRLRVILCLIATATMACAVFIGGALRGMCGWPEPKVTGRRSQPRI